MDWWYEEDWCGRNQCPMLWVIGDEAIDSTGISLGIVVHVTRTGWPVVQVFRNGVEVSRTSTPAAAPELLMPVRGWVLPQ